jgi:acetyl-CoA synthetase
MKQKKNFYWKTKFDSDRVLRYNFSKKKGPVFVEWFKGGTTNVSFNCLDRFLPERKNQIAFYCEGNDAEEKSEITYGQLHEQVVKFSSILRKYGVKKGDTVAIYMPIIPEIIVAMLACSRIGAVHSVIFAGFSSESVRDRLLDSHTRILITANGTKRGSKLVDLKSTCDTACDHVTKNSTAYYKGVEHVIVYQRLDPKSLKTKWVPNRDKWWHELMEIEKYPKDHIEWVDAEHPLFMLYTSGSTGKPKGVIHTTGGYMVYAGTTFKYVFDYHDRDIYFCTADCGWITGHTYLCYGPLLQNATSVLFEGIPTYPNVSRFWEMVDRYKVTQFYTAPTAIRSLMAHGDEPVTSKSKRTTLRVLGSAGEPINPVSWQWYFDVVGNKQAAVVDTYWQTETGGIIITPLPGAISTKPGSATLPFFGVQPVVIKQQDEKHYSVADDTETEGLLAIKSPWPGMARTIYNDHKRYEETYFGMFDGYYFTGDGCRRDKDGYYWLTGRVDDVLNVSGHRLGTAEIENALVAHPSIAEASVVPMHHDIKGEGIYAYVTPKKDIKPDEKLRTELRENVRNTVGPIATPDVIQFAPSLPKTRSGKIIRRVLRKIAAGEKKEALGDMSTVADPSVIDSLIKERDALKNTLKSKL